MRDTSELKLSDEHKAWANTILLSKGAISHCPTHERYFRSQDGIALEKAVKMARRRRPRELSADTADDLLRQQVAGLDLSCPECNRDSSRPEASVEAGNQRALLR